MHTIVDGYNLIFECGLEGRSRSSITLERARDRLISTIASKLPEEQRKGITIVFDAKRLPINEDSAVSSRNEMTIIYAVDHADADSLIEQLIHQNSTPKKLTVVSSDHRIHKSALRRKATPIDSGAWYDRLDELAGRGPGALESSSASEEEDVLDQLQDIDWVREFGLKDRPPSPGDAAKAKQKKHVAFNPFPPGYAEDLLEDPSDDKD